MWYDDMTTMIGIFHQHAQPITTWYILLLDHRFYLIYSDCCLVNVSLQGTENRVSVPQRVTVLFWPEDEGWMCNIWTYRWLSLCSHWLITEEVTFVKGLGRRVKSRLDFFLSVTQHKRVHIMRRRAGVSDISLRPSGRRWRGRKSITESQWQLKEMETQRVSLIWAAAESESGRKENPLRCPAFRCVTVCHSFWKMDFGHWYPLSSWTECLASIFCRQHCGLSVNNMRRDIPIIQNFKKTNI